MKNKELSSGRGRKKILQTTSEPLVLTVQETCKLLRIHRPKVYDLIRDGQIEGFKLGNDWRIRRESVEKLTGPIPTDFFEQEETSSDKAAANE